MLKKIINLVHNMGLKYSWFRLKYEIQRKSGILKKRFPVKVNFKYWVSLEDWKNIRGTFFFQRKEEIKLEPRSSSSLIERINDYKNGSFLFFNGINFNLGLDYDWVTNPETGYQYDVNKHWTEISDFSTEEGDIKYVWEKSRFCFLYDLIRFDYHSRTDYSSDVFKEINSWIDKNPVNCGPNYRCSQEISLRILNWIFALYYYTDSPNLTKELFKKIQNAIYWQIHHVYQNINFSRIAVRNNHAITETLTLYIVSILFPDNPDFIKWGTKAKKWFEEEIAYQVYEDGTYLQFSMNYHRVVVQLMTWGIKLSELNGQTLDNIVYLRAKSSLRFLRVCMEDSRGWLSNYGANDGALFFKLNDNHFRDYQPQLKALAGVLGVDASIQVYSEDLYWYGGKNTNSDKIDLSPTTYRFDYGGYFVFRENESLTFIRCGSHKDRPSQADNLHLDIWYKGQNVLQDAGSYKYNTDKDLLKYFMGTESHNTIMINNEDQMQKGGRFIWFYWTQSKYVEINEDNNSIYFKGGISVFRHLSNNIIHTRKLTKIKGKNEWIIEDEIVNLPVESKINQLWHSPLNSKINFNSQSGLGITINKEEKDSWYSGLYGYKELQKQTSFISGTPSIKTVITIP